jgi:AcrR family transcriptional regulator
MTPPGPGGVPATTLHRHAAGDPTDHRERRDDTRARILDAALDLIADHGFAATSTREISERLGFTKAALYYHFRTKDDLLAAIVGPAIEELAALGGSASAGSPPADRRRIVEGYVDLVASHAKLIRVLMNDPAVRLCRPLAAAKPLYDRLAQVFSGTEAPDTRQRTRVRAAMGAVHAAVLFAEPGDDPRDVHDTALAVACAALGLPGGGRHRRDGGTT